MATDVQVESSSTATAPVPTPAAENFAIPRGDERKEWLRTGKLPETSKPKTEDSAPSSEAKGEEPDGESDSASEAEQQEQKKPNKSRSNAESRIKELLAENKRLKDEVSTRQAKPAEPESQPGKSAEPAKAEATTPQKPKIADFDDWEAYEEARDKWAEEMAEFKANSAVERDRKARADQERQKSLNSEMEKAKERYPDFDDKFAPALHAIADDPAISNQVKELLGASPVLFDLLYTLGGNEDNLADFIKTAKADPLAAIRKAVLLEGLVIEELGKGKAAAKAETADMKRDESGKFQKAPEKTISSAPPPGREVSGKGTPPADSAQSALQRNDVRGYFAAKNQEEINRRKGLSK